MPWYVARVVLECEVLGANAEPLCDEQWRLIEAPNPESAHETALVIGKSEEHEYENSQGNTVRWVFRGLSDLEEILAEKIESGTEICSSLYHGTRSSELVRAKSQLTTSWIERNKAKTAGELLAESNKIYAPR
jgi:hypothetical protein